MLQKVKHLYWRDDTARFATLDKTLESTLSEWYIMYDVEWIDIRHTASYTDIYLHLVRVWAHQVINVVNKNARFTLFVLATSGKFDVTEKAPVNRGQSTWWHIQRGRARSKLLYRRFCRNVYRVNVTNKSSTWGYQRRTRVVLSRLNWQIMQA